MKRGLIILIVILMVALSMCAVSCDKEEDYSKYCHDTFNIMSFNIRQDVPLDTGLADWEYRKTYLVEHIKNKHPQVVGMQEVKKNQYEYLAESLEGYSVVWFSRTVDESQEGLAVAFDTERYDEVSRERFWLSETPTVESKGFGASYYRICVHLVLLDKQANKNISVYCVHLEVRGKDIQKSEIQLVVDRVEADENPSIVLGDFNATSDYPCYAAIDEKMQSVQKDAFASTEEGITYQNFGNMLLVTFDTAIDHIFVSDELFALKYEIYNETTKTDAGEVYYSDHYAVNGLIGFKN